MSESKELLRVLLGQRVVAYHPILAKVMGNASGGIWLSQILYWEKIKSADWFYKSTREIIGETGITEREGKTAKVNAVKLGIVDCQVKGLPRVSHYHVNYDILSSLIETVILLDTEASDKLDNGVQLDGHRCPTIKSPLSNNLGQAPSQNIPQITTETTSKITTEKKHPHGDFNNIFLTEVESGKLLEKFGALGTVDRIQELSHAIASKGYKYKSHYATILTWARKDGQNGAYRGSPKTTEMDRLKASVGKSLD